jgi:nucleoside-diphosphate-sugar epimerase
MPFQSRKLNEDIAWNFGPLNKLNLSVKKILEILCTQNNKKIKINYSKNNFKLEESKNLSINTKKAKKFLNYQLKLNINDTLKLCTDWYNAYNKSIRSSHLVMRLQIANYLKKYYL